MRTRAWSRWVGGRSSALGVALLLCFSAVLGARTYSDNQLYDRGREAYLSRDYLRAAMYLLAFVERDPELMTDPARAEEVRTALQWSEDHAAAAVARAGQLETELQECHSRLAAPGEELPSVSLGLTVPAPELNPRPASGHTSQPSYCLVCRGGGTLLFTYSARVGSSGKPYARIIFERGTGGVGTDWEHVSDLEPGQCSWLDRGVSPDEPDRILLRSPIFRPREFLINWTEGRVMSISNAMPYLTALSSADALQSFYVYNDSHGNLIAARLGEQR